MDEFKIKNLSAKISDFSIDKFNLSRRIKSEHLFVSIDECVEYLKNTICEKRINPDDLFFISHVTTPVLYANILDEATVSIIYESYKLRQKKDRDLLAYNRVKVDDFSSFVLYEKDKLLPHDDKRAIYNALYILLNRISEALNPIEDSKEENHHSDLALYYYNLMYTVYKYLFTKGIEKEYCDRCMSIYSKYIRSLYSEYAPMGYCI